MDPAQAGNPVNIGELLLVPLQAGQRVLGIQAKLHHWAVVDDGRRFDDLFNLVVDPAFLTLAWERVRENKGAKTAGIDGATRWSVENSERGVAGFLEELRASVKDRTFQPVAVRTVLIPKTGGKLRRLGIPTLRDRVVQASLKLVLEPILEVDCDPCSYGFRPGRRCQDAIEEIRFYAARGYEHVFEGDIAACFDEISHPALMDRLRRRVGDRRVLALVKAFLKAGPHQQPVPDPGPQAQRIARLPVLHQVRVGPPHVVVGSVLIRAEHSARRLEPGPQPFGAKHPHLVAARDRPPHHCLNSFHAPPLSQPATKIFIPLLPKATAAASPRTTCSPSSLEEAPAAAKVASLPRCCGW